MSSGQVLTIFVLLQACKGIWLEQRGGHPSASCLRPWPYWFQWLCWLMCHSLQGHPPALSSSFTYWPQCSTRKEFDPSTLHPHGDSCVPRVGGKAQYEWFRCHWVVEEPEKVHGQDLLPPKAPTAAFIISDLQLDLFFLFLFFCLFVCLFFSFGFCTLWAFDIQVQLHNQYNIKLLFALDMILRQFIGVGAGPVLPGPLFRRFNFARAYY